MSTQITVELPDEVYEQVAYVARMSGRGVAEVVVDTVKVSLAPLGASSLDVSRIEGLPDHDVLRLADSEMPSSDSRRLSALLDRQQAGALTVAEQTDLDALVRLYQDGTLRKARAFREAVRRGLRERLEG